MVLIGEDDTMDAIYSIIATAVYIAIIALLTPSFSRERE